VLEQARRMLRVAGRLGGGYGERSGPLGEREVVCLLRRSGAAVEYYPFESRRVGFAMWLGGRAAVAIDSAAEERLRGLAVRHELYHVLAGDLVGAVGGGMVGLGEGESAPGERAADLFALADLVPRLWLEGQAERSWAVREVLLAVAAHWRDPRSWLEDRARLRVALHAGEGRG
jgi:hypothetical protein